MMVITKKFKMRDILIFALVIVAILAVLLIPGKSPETESTQETKTEIRTNEDRIAYLQQLGYEVEQSPLKEREVRIPDAEDPVFTRYNALQLSQGFDLTQYAGKVAKQFVYLNKKKVGCHLSSLQPLPFPVHLHILGYFSILYSMSLCKLLCSFKPSSGLLLIINKLTKQILLTT